MYDGVIYWVLVMFFPVLFVISYFIYHVLEKKGIFPKVYHPYTGKRTFSLYFDFTRFFFFVVLAVFFAVTLQFIISMVLLVLAFIHLTILKMNFEQKAGVKNRQEFIYQEFELTEAEAYFKESVPKRKVKLWKKFVLVGDVIYFGRFRKLNLRDKIYRYMFLSKIERKEKHLLFYYGFLGIPMFKRYVYVPKSKEKDIEKLIKEVKKIKDNSKTRLEQYIIKKATERFEGQRNKKPKK